MALSSGQLVYRSSPALRLEELSDSLQFAFPPGRAEQQEGLGRLSGSRDGERVPV